MYAAVNVLEFLYETPQGRLFDMEGKREVIRRAFKFSNRGLFPSGCVLEIMLGNGNIAESFNGWFQMNFQQMMLAAQAASGKPVIDLALFLFLVWGDKLPQDVINCFEGKTPVENFEAILKAALNEVNIQLPSGTEFVLLLPSELLESPQEQPAT